MTLEELASAAGMNTSFLHSIETAKKKPSLRMIQNIAGALILPVHTLFLGAEQSAKPDAYVGRLAALVRDADDRRRKTILRVVKDLSKDPPRR